MHYMYFRFLACIILEIRQGQRKEVVEMTALYVQGWKSSGYVRYSGLFKSHRVGARDTSNMQKNIGGVWVRWPLPIGQQSLTRYFSIFLDRGPSDSKVWLDISAFCWRRGPSNSKIWLDIIIVEHFVGDWVTCYYRISAFFLFQFSFQSSWELFSLQKEELLSLNQNIWFKLSLI